MALDYHDWYRRAKAERARILGEKQKLLSEIENRDQQLAALAQTMRAIAPLVGEKSPEADEESEPPRSGMTDTIRAILNRSKEPLTASELRECLESIGFDVNSYSNPLATIHTVLRRLREAGEVETTHDVEKIAGKAFKIGKYNGFVGVGRLRRRNRTTGEDARRKS